VEQRELTFVIPTYRLRDVGETVAEIPENYERGDLLVENKAFYGFEPGFFQYNLVRIVDDVISVIKRSIELWPRLIEICNFQKDRHGLPQLRVQNRKA
jgi:hypothetical protein